MIYPLPHRSLHVRRQSYKRGKLWRGLSLHAGPRVLSGTVQHVLLLLHERQLGQLHHGVHKDPRQYSE